MKKVLFYALVAISVALTATSCIGGGSGVDRWYYIYIAGDTGRIVRISYLEWEKTKNTSGDMSMDGSPAPEYYPGNDDVIITENVTLPFFKEVHTIGGAPDEFLEVTSENDTTTKAAIFNNGLWFPDTCMVMSVFFPENGREEKCAYCKTLTRDSVLSYLKGISYPCYLEFSQGDVSKRVRMYDYYRRPNQ